MEILGTTRLIALLGDPVSHSLSPSMHNPAFDTYGIDFAYVPLRVRAEDLKTAVEALRIFNFRGANVTLPHKQAIIPYLDVISDISRLMGAVNTVVNENGRLIGTTTDPEGFLTGFREAGFSFAGKQVAVFGNGGSARTIAFALLTQLLEEAPEKVLLVGRDPAKSKRLVAEINAVLDKAGGDKGISPPMGPKRPVLEAAALADYPALRGDVDILVNATPLGMQPNTDASPVRPEDLLIGQIVYDIVYTPEKTRLIQDAQAMGLNTVGGLGMLVHQGRASFRLWTGTTPDAGPFYASARAQLARSGRPEDHKIPPAAGRGISEDP